MALGVMQNMIVDGSWDDHLGIKSGMRTKPGHQEFIAFPFSSKKTFHDAFLFGGLIY